VNEVVQHLTSQAGCEVEVTMEIRAKLEKGFEDSTIRTVTENSRTLKFDAYEFEE